MTTPKHPVQRPKPGRPPQNTERGTLVPLYCRIYADQAEWLAGQSNQQAVVRDALDMLSKSSK